MDVVKLLAELRDYKVQVDEAIAALDRLARQRGEKRGRPVGISAGPRRKVSEETRRKMAAAQRKRWAAYRKSKAKGGEG
jgi:hypothetical protein